MKDELNSLLKSGVIEKACSPWASTTMFVPKKRGKLRLVQDYRKLNSVTEFDAYPMPLIDQLIDEVGQSKFISTLAAIKSLTKRKQNRKVPLLHRSGNSSLPEWPSASKMHPHATNV